MTDLSQVTYCGLYCGLCAQRGRIPDQADALRGTMRKEGWDQWGGHKPGFDGFWSFLNDLADSASRCTCRDGQCGPPFCGIRKCAQKRAIDVCAFCDEYPCHRIQGLAKGYVTLVADGRRMKEIGLDAWIAEQEQRRATGFAYADIRCQPYEVPEE